MKMLASFATLVVFKNKPSASPKKFEKQTAIMMCGACSLCEQ